MPILWLNVFSILLGAVPLLPAAGRTPARAWLTRERTAGLRPRLVEVIARRGSRWPAT